MAAIKSFTSLEQSRKLAKILPLESADMYYEEVCNLPKVIVGNYILHNQCMEDKDYKKLSNPVLSPAWSLVTLLSVLPNGIVMNKDSQNGKYHFSSKYIGTYVTADNPVDACVSMIEKLHELNLL